MFSQSVRTIMDPRKLILVPGTMTVREAAKLMKTKHYGAVLITEGEELLGIFTERDAVFRVLAVGRDPEATQLADVMTKEPKTIAPEKTFGHAMLMMHEGGFRHVPVVDDGKLVGMVSSRNALDPDLEEFVFEERRRKHLLETR
ncbi:MAG TPA: CBS domain-containing protein [Burkholderiaceae bacterium]|nr:CBS domain-containing protein [Burkholderiaceae bacterium]